MKFLLIYPPTRVRETPAFPPTGLSYIASAIERAGHKAEIVDLPYLLDKQPDKYSVTDTSLYDYILSRDFDVIGYGGLSPMYFFYEGFTKYLKEKRKDTPVIVGGIAGMTIKEVWEKYTDVDYMVDGDGEEVIREFCRYYESDREKLNRIPGLYVRRDGKLVGSPPVLIKDIDSIPFLSYDGIDHEYYIKELGKFITDVLPDGGKFPHVEFRVLPLLTSRGCPFRCSFCFHFNSKHRNHSVGYVIDNIKFLKDKYRVNCFYIIDDLFVFRRDFVIELCSEIVRQKLNVYFFGSGGKPNLVTREMLVKMKEAGFIRFSYGIESGSQKMLNMMRKKTTVKQNREALKMTDEVGIQSSANMMFAHPGETPDTIRETTEFLKTLDYSSKKFRFSWAVAYPGTQLFDELKARGVLKNVDDVRDYVYNVGSAGLGSVGKYVYNFTDMASDSLLDIHNKIYLDIDRHYYLKKRKDFLGFRRHLMGYPYHLKENDFRGYLGLLTGNRLEDTSSPFYKFTRLMHLLVHPKELAMALGRRIKRSRNSQS